MHAIKKKSLHYDEMQKEWPTTSVNKKNNASLCI